ncbi:MAG: 5-formyltetrahydrofolate cyclo-ligase [Deltaproteobacteria bacterium]|nr:5-formyltetrahydrofolate cyclo-ligase [Deltaproteobacteria bacterium]
MSQYSHYQPSFASWSQEICRYLQSHPAFLKANRVAIFYPRLWEVNLLSLWQQRPQVCGFPKTDAKSWEMHFYWVKSLNSQEMGPGVGGIFEPINFKGRELAPFEKQDLILVPGVAFDNQGGRVGSGKGVYDRFLSGEGKAAQKWGVAFSPQIRSENIPLEPHDSLLDSLVTEKGFIYF